MNNVQLETQQQAWDLYNWMKEQNVLGKEDKAIGNAGNPDYDPNNDNSNQTTSS